jgi:hypothetical protein
MVKASTGGYKRFLKRFRTGRILNKIRSGKIVYLENPVEEIVLRYVPREYGRCGKYYVKHYGRDKQEISYDSVSILMAVMEGRRISKSRYDSYHLNESVIWNRKINEPAMQKSVNSTWVYV